MTSVKVAVRVRPVNQREVDLGSKVIIKMDSTKTSITNLKMPGSVGAGDTGREQMRVKDFTFDHSFWSANPEDKHYVSQENVYNALGSDILSSAYEGYNVCVFAYGQTGSGKSYTMMGDLENEGLIPRFCQSLFSRMTDENTSYRTEVSYLEIYNEKVRDLLRPNSTNKPVYSLRVREHPKEGPYVQDLSKHIVKKYGDIHRLMSKGNINRTTASTNMNDVSSRSHAIFTIVFTQARFVDEMPMEMHSKIHLVDLAGSERADASGAKGQRLKEGASINKSLVTLGNVISVLAEMSEKTSRSNKPTFIPYRDSVLTWLLKDSLGGNAKTIMIATISPADVNYGETLSTLRYANRAKDIINRPTINEDPNVKLIRELREEIARLQGLIGGDVNGTPSPKVQEKLHEKEARIKILTQEWAGKWKEAATILQEQKTLALRKEGLGVVLDSTLPHLIGIEDDILSTGIMLYHLKEGVTTIGADEAGGAVNGPNPDIALSGPKWRGNTVRFATMTRMFLHPLGDSLCMVNGYPANEPVKLTQGAVIVLGRTNMFRFNHPEEAAKLKEEMSKSTSNLNLSTNSLLSHSRTSLLSHSMTDLYRSTDSLSPQSSGWELEHVHREELEKLDQKRQEIEELEERYRGMEEDRMIRQIALEKELSEKQECLEEMRESLQQLQHMLGSEDAERLDYEDMLQKLDEREQQQLASARRMKAELGEEIVELRKHQEEIKADCDTMVDKLEQKEQEKRELISNLEEEIRLRKDSLYTEKTKGLKSIEQEKGQIQLAQKQLEEEKNKLLAKDEGLKKKFSELSEKEKSLNVRLKKLDQEKKERWKQLLDEVAEENKKIEEAWSDLKEHEVQLEEALRKAVCDKDEDERHLVECEQRHLDSARELLREEEEKVAGREHELIELVEREMDEWEREKAEGIGQIQQEKNSLLASARTVAMDKLEKEIEDRTDAIDSHAARIVDEEETVLRLEKQLNAKLTDVHREKDAIHAEREQTSKMADVQVEQKNKYIEEIQAKMTEIDDECEAELGRIKKERNRLMSERNSRDASCVTDIEGLLGAQMDGKIQQFEAEKTKLYQQTQEMERLREDIERGQQELEEKRRKFEEERDTELDRIEFEKFRLQDMEHKERINSLVEQEVKRRLFEEKVERDRLRKIDKENERIEREKEILRLKAAHSRELKQLRAKLENNGMGRVSTPTRSNPYTSTMSLNNNISSPDQSPRRMSQTSGSSSSGSFSSPSSRIYISIPTFTLRGHGSDAHHEYEVKVSVGEDTWTIFRRYSRFRDLYQIMKKKYPETSILVFPPRKMFSKSEKVVAERRVQLEQYLKNLIEVCMRSANTPLHPTNNKHMTKLILCDFDPFFRKGLFETAKHCTA
ncbi:LOW QUALITY PROTEIN: kinesin-like protein KIF16B [Haliotis rubra]|uniref:LOW QUALITY PROTEIN: kinesin-like protein KIF16B n=1 Tax=Haliotis rubra TaxID=36100 RepID=UPI001EE4F109|nr:LOW QUALITY PROTEIN: kinesin-like protein KIF16B [Haliotis rubra]